MNIQLNEEQKLISESVNKYIVENYLFDKRAKILDGQDSYSKKIWQDFCQLGWLGLPFSDTYGGLGGGAIEIVVLMEAFGRGLVLEPYISSILLGGKSIDIFGNEEQKKKYLRPLINGKLMLALAFSEPNARYNLNYINTKAAKTKDGWKLSGEKNLVLGANVADFIVIPARTSGNITDKSGINFFVLHKDTKGLSLRNYKTVDGFSASNISLNDIEVSNDCLLGKEIDTDFYKKYEKMIDFATLAMCGEALGIIDVMYSKTLEYIKTREQFGKPIGSFQVIQHRAVEMFMKTEEMRSITYMSGLHYKHETNVRKKNISAAKIFIGTSGINLGQEAIQLHGGMGVADEMQISHFFKRLTILEIMFGNADYHLSRYAECDKDI